MKISVVVTSYNHEKYIHQCIDSILNQKGDFEMEIILGDDHSSDRTSLILQEYVKDHPGVFIPLPSEKNLGITKNLQRCLKACNGEYIAICEGDDYWTDPEKLQKQMKFLELHPEYSMCFSALEIYYEEENRFGPHTNQQELDKEALTIQDLLKVNYIGNFSCCMYRQSTIQQLPQGLFDMYTVDWMFNMACSEIGKIGYIHEPMSVYRKHANGAWTSKSEMEQLADLVGLIDIYNNFFLYKYDKPFMKFKNTIVAYINWVNEHPKDEAKDKAKVQLTDTDTKLLHLTHLDLQSNVPLRAKIAAIFSRLWKHGVVTFKNIFRPYWRMLIKFRNETFDLNVNSNSLMSKVIKSLIEIILSPPQRLAELRITKNKQTDLVILDTIFPHQSSPFRYQEFIEYLDHFPKTMVFSTCHQFKLFSESRSPRTVIEEFENAHPLHKGKILYTKYRIGLLRAKLAYTTFLSNMDLFLRSLERNRVPFVFTLYPGGAFELDQPASDVILSKTFHSPQFRKVIVTQKITYDYLLRKNFCPPDKIEFIYGVVTPLPLATDLIHKQHFGFNKQRLDICFVAYKYMEKGIDKGYDVFIEAARKLTADHENIHFHVVGTFDEKDIPIEGLEGKITFHGIQTKDWFGHFYQTIDIILSPNVPFTLLKGSFDGFPTASCTDAGLQEVAIFCTDELDLNIRFVDRRDLVVVPHDAHKIAILVEYYYNHPEQLVELSRNGAAKIREIYNYENQIAPRIRILEEELSKCN